uniref:Protein FRA10AC1 n=1 Tax=Ditylenchus dipsaci TaxID=166011 RepID=A0A915E1Y0_9BILA
MGVTIASSRGSSRFSPNSSYWEISMARRNVYDDANPFAPELKRAKMKPSPVVVDVVRKVKPTFERLKMRLHGMDAYTRHKQFINNYVLFHRGSTSKIQRDTSNDKNDFDIIRENHRFLWDDGAEQSSDPIKTWESNLAKKYYDKLFKEYCIADLSQYKQNRVALRWRTEKEVFSSKGQFECGSKHCQRRDDLSTWEVNFAYLEQGERKNALVKIRLCPECSSKLNFHSQKRLIKREKKAVKEEQQSIAEEKKRKPSKKIKKHKKRSHSSSESTDSLPDIEPSSSGQVKQETSDEQKGKDTETSQKKALQEASEIWTKKTAVVDAEKTVEDEFDEFFDDLFL